MLWPTRSPSNALPTGASTEIFPASASASFGYTKVSEWCLLPDSSTQSADEFMLTTSCGICAGSTISARSNSSCSFLATGESRSAGASSSASMRSTSSLERVIGVLVSMSGLRVFTTNIASPTRFHNGRRGQGGGVEQCARQLLENLGQFAQETVHRRAPAPEHRDAAARRVVAEGRQVHVRRVRDRRLHRQHRQQRDADIGCDHLAQRLEAGGAETLSLVGAGHAADLQRLVAEAMPVLEQQQALA